MRLMIEALRGSGAPGGGGVALIGFA
jgi:hypothetical protein